MQDHTEGIGSPATSVDVLRASPHAWGPGKVHLIHDDPEGGLYRTRCGKPAETVPGLIEVGHPDQVDCKGCLNSLEAAIRREREAAKWEARRAEVEAERRAEAERWWARYNEHLASPEWQRLRRLVFERSHGLCEGCRVEVATQVHHLTYAHVGEEFLFELVAICRPCHERISIRQDG